MKFNIIGRKYTVKDSVKDYVEKKLSKLDRALTLYSGHGQSCTLGEALDNLYI